MSRFGVLSAALAAALFALPAEAEPNLAGATWGDDDCMIAFEFHADYTFLEYDVVDDNYTGRWRVEAGMLYLQYDGGWSVETPISDNMFSLRYGDSDDESYECYFTPY